MLSSASPKPAPSSASHSGIISAPDSPSPASPQSLISPILSSIAAQQPECPAFCPCYQIPYSKEQGNFLSEQGVRFGEQGISSQQQGNRAALAGTRQSSAVFLAWIL